MSSNDLAVERERSELLERVAHLLETPMTVLGGVWLVLLIVELTRGLDPLLQAAANVIWLVFVADFSLRFAIAPHKIAYLKAQWLVALSLALPALRTLRLFRGWRLMSTLPAGRATRLFRLIASMNRGLRALSAAFARRGFGYVVALTVTITLAGAAGMFAFENSAPGGGFQDYATALWWTAMIMTTMGSDYWPATPEGRILCVLLSLYAFAVFGYVTATLATFFIDRDAERPDAALAVGATLAALVEEVRLLRAAVRRPAGGGDA